MWRYAWPKSTQTALQSNGKMKKRQERRPRKPMWKVMMLRWWIATKKKPTRMQARGSIATCSRIAIAPRMCSTSSEAFSTVTMILTQVVVIAIAKTLTMTMAGLWRPTLWSLKTTSRDSNRTFSTRTDTTSSIMAVDKRNVSVVSIKEGASSSSS